MKKLLLILIALPMIGFGQNVNIPDANFKAYLVGNTAINTNGDSEIQVSEAIAFNGSINCSSMNISDLTGIEAFTALTYLNCKNNQLTTLDLSNNKALTRLYCESDQLKNIDFGNNAPGARLRINETGADGDKEESFLVFSIFFIIVISVWYMIKPKCPQCKKKVFKKPEVLDTKFTNTSPRKKDGGYDKRYNTRGYWSKLKKWTCKCGYSWQKWI
jgi:hypothetical protein